MWRRLYLVLPSVYIVLSYMILLLGVETTALLADEDGFFEYLGVLAFLLAAILFLVAFIRSRRLKNRTAQSATKRFVYLALALILLMAAGEEISWGQRLLGIETPEFIREINIQDEINIHNLELFQIAAKRNVLRWLWHIFWLTFTLGLPLTAAVYEPGRRFLDRVVPLIPWRFGLIFLANYVIWRAIYEMTPKEVYLNYPEEIMESNISILFLVIALWIIRESLAGRDSCTV